MKFSILVQILLVGVQFNLMASEYNLDAIIKAKGKNNKAILEDKKLKKYSQSAQKKVVEDYYYNYTLPRQRAEEKSRRKWNASGLDFVSVKAEFVTGGFTTASNLHMSPADPNAHIGRFKPDFSGAPSGAIYKQNYNGIAGYYNYSFQSESGNIVCSGHIYVSGKKQYLTLSVYTDCKDAGSREN